MARKKLMRGLAVLPAVSLLKGKEHKTARLLEILRGVALNNQRDKSQFFYPVREVASHFHVTISTVARVYSHLEDEGLLVSIRGSKTLLQGLESGRHFSALGFVGMPAAISSFVTLQDYRSFLIRTRRELRARGFAVVTIFFEPRDIKSGRLGARINKYDVDTVLWHRPEAPAKEIVSRLRDRGIQVLCIRDGTASTVRCRYDIHRDAAITAILRDWRSNGGIKSVVIIRGIHVSAAKEEMLQMLLEEEQLAYEFRSAGSQGLEGFLGSLAGDKQRGIIFPSQAASMCAFRAPEALTKLMSHARVALTGGGVSMPFAQVPDVRADLVVVDWQLVAERITNDLISKKAFDRAETVFEAQALLRAPFNQYAQIL